MIKNIIAKTDNQTIQKTFNNTHIVVVDSDSVQLFNKKIVRYDFPQDKQNDMYTFFKQMQDDAEHGSQYDTDKFTIHVKDNVIYDVASQFYGIRSNKIKSKGMVGYKIG